MNNDFSDLDPELVGVVEDKAIGLLGYVVVDRTIGGRSLGGLRMLPDVSIDELKGLARAMTLKLGFSGVAQGGAKAGMVCDLDTPVEMKKKLLQEFGRRIGPLLRSQYYITGPDMNTPKELINDMLESLGAEIPKPHRQRGIKSGFFTALGVLAAAEAALGAKGKELANTSVAIEGFGSVGSSLAWLIDQKWRAKVVAISTSRGGLYDENGLDIPDLCRMGKEMGGRVVEAYEKGEKIEREQVLTLDVDMLSPCARHHSISVANVNEIKAPIVCPGANIPITREAEKVLFEKGILSVPYLVANCGGIVGNKIELTGLGDGFIWDFLRKNIGFATLSVIQESERVGVPMMFIAEQYAMHRFETIKRGVETGGVKTRLFRAAVNAFNKGLIPEVITRQIGPVYFNRALGHNEPLRWKGTRHEAASVAVSDRVTETAE